MPLYPRLSDLEDTPQWLIQKMLSCRLYVPAKPFPNEGSPEFNKEMLEIYEEARVALKQTFSYEPTIIEAFALHKISRDVARQLKHEESSQLCLGGVSKVSNEVLDRFFDWAYGLRYYDLYQAVKSDVRSKNDETNEYLRRLQDRTHTL